MTRKAVKALGDILRKINETTDEFQKAVNDIAAELDDEVDAVEAVMASAPARRIHDPPISKSVSEWALAICADVAQAKDEDDQTLRVMRWVESVRDDTAEACAQICDERERSHNETIKKSTMRDRGEVCTRAGEASKCARKIREVFFSGL